MDPDKDGPVEDVLPTAVEKKHRTHRRQTDGINDVQGPKKVKRKLSQIIKAIARSYKVNPVCAQRLAFCNVLYAVYNQSMVIFPQHFMQRWVYYEGSRRAVFPKSAHVLFLVYVLSTICELSAWYSLPYYERFDGQSSGGYKWKLYTNLVKVRDILARRRPDWLWYCLDYCIRRACRRMHISYNCNIKSVGITLILVPVT